MTTAQDGGKVVSFTHRPPLPPGNIPGYSFLLEAESTPEPCCDRKDYVAENSNNSINSWSTYRSRIYFIFLPHFFLSFSVIQLSCLPGPRIICISTLTSVLSSILSSHITPYSSLEIPATRNMLLFQSRWLRNVLIRHVFRHHRNLHHILQCRVTLLLFPWRNIQFFASPLCHWPFRSKVLSSPSSVLAFLNFYAFHFPNLSDQYLPNNAVFAL